MQTKTKAQPVFYRQSFTERLIFTSKPDAATRKALRDGGWKWNRAGGGRTRHPAVEGQGTGRPPRPAPVVEQPEGEPEAN
ncbi:MAG: hypothetical protein U0835_00540 [Isosphaeraceae bacterium]